MKTDRAAVALAVFGGVGYSPVAPGTAGAVAAAVVGFGVLRATGWPPWTLGLGALLLFWPAVWASRETERVLGGHDPQCVVVDEVVGQWIALATTRGDQWLDWLLAVALFRLFDIAKPPPIRRLERLPGGLGVVADDAAAGLCAMLIFVIYRAWAPL